MPIAPSFQEPASQRFDSVDVRVPQSISRHVTQAGLILAALSLLPLRVSSGISKRSRRAITLCVVLILSLNAFSIAIHSVHHLFDP